jgi:hypothetical protein
VVRQIMESTGMLEVARRPVDATRAPPGRSCADLVVPGYQELAVCPYGIGRER